MTELTYVYDDAYLAWQLDDGHPTDPVRALNCRNMLTALNVPMKVVEARLATHDELLLAHTDEYVTETLLGRNSQWAGEQTVLGSVARVMAGGTMLGVDLILNGDDDGPVTRVFNPQGAKHHAMFDHGSGFCVFNDMAMAAHRFTHKGMKVAYVDWDVHHGDGVQAGFDRIGYDLERGEGARTWSVFGHGFAEPSTLMTDPDGKHVHACLEDGAGDREWIAAIDLFADGIERYSPDVLLIATGADSHVGDPLGGLRVTAEGYYMAGKAMNDLATFLDIPVLMGGAGGYQPFDWTPLCWAMVAKALTE